MRTGCEGSGTTNLKNADLFLSLYKWCLGISEIITDCLSVEAGSTPAGIAIAEGEPLYQNPLGVFLSNKHPGKQAPQAWASVDAGTEYIVRLLDLR